MVSNVYLPVQIVRRLASRRDAIARQRDAAGALCFWRETYILPREKARMKAREWMERPRRSAYVTEVENWRELGDGRIEFTIRRVPAD
ncbi:MAG: hypothetical protein ACOYJQ_01660 [Pseudochelatococcus sp.]|jgi:hypothetical protein|uniref:hypothetical protein n=1 Tax=Pseudochelatococcus sp. TaxID=2020869 RepID=UPI003D8B3527